jgi:outer membrane lipoprotein-sorting protein
MRLLLVGFFSLIFISYARAEFPLDKASTRDQILDALDARGNGLKDFTADVSLATSDALGGDTTKLVGKVAYQSKGNGDSRLRIIFDQKFFGAKQQPNSKVEYMLDKGWLGDRDYKRKIEVMRQVLKPGEKTNLLKLGEGPFPLPIGQPREEVLKQFDVKKIDAKPDDPADTVHLELAPKEGTRFAKKFQKIDVWAEMKTNFPRRIETLDKAGGETRTTDLTNIKVNVGLSDKDFEQEKIGNDWTQKSEQME